MKIVYLPSAENDLLWFYEYYTSVFPEGSPKALKQLDKTAQLLCINPYIGKEVQEHGGKLREFVVTHTPFSYIYQISDQSIQVLRLWDNRQDSLIWRL